MASAILANRVRVNTATTGTGTVTLGAAFANNFTTFAEAGITNAQQVRYELEEGTDFEIGLGTYTSAGTTLSRDTVNISKIGGTSGTSKMNLAGAATVRIVFTNEDYLNVVPTTRTVSAAGLATGGGDLSANRTVTVTAAVQSDQETGSSTSVAVVPGVQQFHPSSAKCWLRATVSGAVPTLQESYNITSITDTATGRMVVTIATDFSSAGWCAQVTLQQTTATNRVPGISDGTLAAGSVELLSGNGGTPTDPTAWFFVGLGDQ